jgi:hypothetical protein
MDGRTLFVGVDMQRKRGELELASATQLRCLSGAMSNEEYAGVVERMEFS